MSRRRPKERRASAATPRVFVEHRAGRAPVAHVCIPWEALGVDPRVFDGFTDEDWRAFWDTLDTELGLAPTGTDAE